MFKKTRTIVSPELCSSKPTGVGTRGLATTPVKVVYSLRNFDRH